MVKIIPRIESGRRRREVVFTSEKENRASLEKIKKFFNTTKSDNF